MVDHLSGSRGPTARLLDATRFRPDFASHCLRDSGDTVTGPHIRHRAGTSAKGGMEGHRTSGPERGDGGLERPAQEGQVRWQLGQPAWLGLRRSERVSGLREGPWPGTAPPFSLPLTGCLEGGNAASQRQSFWGGREGEGPGQNGSRTLGWGREASWGGGSGSRGWPAGQRDRERTSRGRDAQGPRGGRGDRPRQPTRGLLQGPWAQRAWRVVTQRPGRENQAAGQEPPSGLRPSPLERPLQTPRVPYLSARCLARAPPVAAQPSICPTPVTLHRAALCGKGRLAQGRAKFWS